MATNETIKLKVLSNKKSVPLDTDSGSPYYVGARAYVTQDVDGATITVIDKEGTTTATVYDGEDGQDGQDGADGQDGFSPIANVTKVDDVTTITITDAYGTTTAYVYDGSVGGVNDVEVDGVSVVDEDGIAEITMPTVPTKVSDLTNDAGYISSYTETDPVFSASAAAGITSSDISSWNGKSTFSGNYNDLSNKPTIPSKVSDLTNDSKFINGNTGGVFYGTCATAAATVEKDVVCDDFTANDLVAGAIVFVRFSVKNTGAVGSLKLDVNSTGAKPIKFVNNGALGNLSSAGYLAANVTYLFFYDGTNWVAEQNVNSTYSALSEADMHTGTATTAKLITAARLKEAVEYHAPVTSVNGNNGDVILSTSDLTNNGDGTSLYVTENALANPTFCATDATTQAVLQQAFGVSAEVVVPSGITSTAALLHKLEPRTWFCWMNGTEMEFARLSVSVNTSNSAITMYLRGRTSIATGIMGVDSSWTVTPLASDAEGVAY